MKINSRRKQKKKMAVLIWMTAVLAGIVTTGMIIYYKKDGLHHTSEKTPVQSSPKELLIEYMNHIPEREWEKMYEMLDIEASGNIRFYQTKFGDLRRNRNAEYDNRDS